MSEGKEVGARFDFDKLLTFVKYTSFTIWCVYALKCIKYCLFKNLLSTLAFVWSVGEAFVTWHKHDTGTNIEVK